MKIIFMCLSFMLLANCSNVHSCTYFDNYKNWKGKAKLVKNIDKEVLYAQVKCKLRGSV
jgi:hypothetical protein